MKQYLQELASAPQTTEALFTTTETTNQLVLDVDATDAVCVDYIDLGVQDTEWGPKPQCRFVFETALKKDNGFPVYITRTFTKSTHEKSALRPFIEKWRGYELTAEEIAAGVDYEKMKGKPARITYQDTVSKNGHAYLKVQDITPGTTKMKPSGNYRRFEIKGNSNN